MSHQKTHPYPGYCGLCTDDDAVKWPVTCDQGQGSAADTFSTCVMNSQAHDSELQRAPRMRLISLPSEENEEHRLYGGPDLGGWMPGTLNGIPKTMMLDYLEPEFPLPVPFSTVD
jgi:hypothetical protein